MRSTSKDAGLELSLPGDACAPRYRQAPGWTLDAAGDRLLVHAGADHVFAIDEVPPDAAAEVLAFWRGAPAGRGSVSRSRRAAEALDQLVLVGALIPVVGTPGVPLAVALSVVGRPVGLLAPALAAALEAPAGGCAVELVAPETAALVVYVRTTAALAEVAAAAAAGPPVPHLLADLAYHHTISLGPLVVPGDTACLTCLAGRIGAVWGDVEPPEAPLAARNTALAAGLLANELTKVAAGDRGLANRTVALDLASLRIVEGTLLKNPWCPACSQAASPGGSNGFSGRPAGDGIRMEAV